MPTNMNTGRFRTRRDCCHVKHNQSINDLHNGTYYPCGQKPTNDAQLIKHYKNYINRGLEHVQYLEKKSCIIQQRKMLRKKPVFIQQNTNVNTRDSFAYSRLQNF